MEGLIKAGRRMHSGAGYAAKRSSSTMFGAGRRAVPLISSTARDVALGRTTRLACTRQRTSPTATTSTTTTTTAPRRHYSGERSKPEARPRPTNPPPEKPAPGGSLLSVYVGRYHDLLESQPLATKAVTSGIIAFAGDMTWQLVSIEMDHSSNRSAEDDDDEEAGGIRAGRSKMARIAPEIDWGRAARFTLVGAAYLAPVLHTWYGFLTRRFPGTAASAVVKRVALDQLVFAPVFLASFLSIVMLLDGNAAKIAPKLRADYTATVASNWEYWIPAQIINFRYVAPVYQVLYANSAGFFWNIYLSYQANKEVRKEILPPGVSTPDEPTESRGSRA